MPKERDIPHQKGRIAMHIQVNTDNHIVGRESLASWVQAEVAGAMDRFGEQVTRVEVHLGDENSVKSGGDDKRCMLEARLAGLQPIAVTHHAPTLREAVSGAIDKLEKSLDRTVERLGDAQKRRTRDDGV
jgi:ribosome-associated translation inhibitor RaiA